MSEPETPPPPDPAPKKPTPAQQKRLQQIERGRLTVVENALIAFLEELLGRVPTDAEIISKGQHVTFSPTPLTTLTRDGCTFNRFYVWDRQHVIALGFMDAKKPLDLSVVRIARENWPTALRLYIEQHNADGSPGAPMPGH